MCEQNCFWTVQVGCRFTYRGGVLSVGTGLHTYFLPYTQESLEGLGGFLPINSLWECLRSESEELSRDYLLGMVRAEVDERKKGGAAGGEESRAQEAGAPRGRKRKTRSSSERL